MTTFATTAVSLTAVLSAALAPLSSAAPAHPAPATEGQATAVESINTSLEDTTWHLKGAPDAHFRITGERITGSDSCNTFTGTATAYGEHVEFGPLATTLMACMGTEDTQQTIHAALREQRIVGIDGTTLTLTDAVSGDSWEFTAE